MSEQVPVENRASLPPAEFDALARDLSGLTSMRSVLAWLTSRVPPLKVVDMTTQDEFSHDILVAYRGGRYLVYDST